MTAPMDDDIRHSEAPDRSPLAPLADCPLCGARLAPEHAHLRCRACGWRDSCCD